MTFGLFTAQIDVDVKNIDMTEITKKALKKSVVHHTKGINKAFVVDERRPVGTTEKVLKTDGINIEVSRIVLLTLAFCIIALLLSYIQTPFGSD